jgi:hypothetical protein
LLEVALYFLHMLDAFGGILQLRVSSTQLHMCFVYVKSGLAAAQEVWHALVWQQDKSSTVAK